MGSGSEVLGSGFSDELVNYVWAFSSVHSWLFITGGVY